MVGTLTPLFTFANQQLLDGTLLALIFTGHGLYVKLKCLETAFLSHPGSTNWF